MRIAFRAVTTAASFLALAGTIAFTPVSAEDKAAVSPLEEGKKLAFDRKFGNCLACHMIQGGELPGTIGPPLVAMKARFPDKAVLREQIYDATKKNPNSMMPPFGPNGIMTDDQIDKVVEFIYTL
jgi:sulfur-oxidizing protein SoxX